MADVRVGVVGAGAVGARCARQLLSSDGVASVVVVDPVAARAGEVVASLGGGASVGAPPPVAGRAGSAHGAATALTDVEVVVLCGPAGSQVAAAAAHLAAGTSVVSTSDDLEEVQALLDLDAAARAADATLVVGAGFSPGLSDLLAAHGANRFDTVSEVHVARMGTGGPACAVTHHRALGRTSLDWRDGAWVRRPAGSGRELVWFPDPVAARDCYRAALPDALLLVPAFDGVDRVTARVAATRRDRVTARLPMLRRPHADGGPGALRVELRGLVGSTHEVVVLGAMDRPAVAAGAVAAVAAMAVAEGAARSRGAGGMAALFDPLPLLLDLARRGIRCAVFDPVSEPFTS